MSAEIAVVEDGYWQFDGARCERATLIPDLPDDVIGFVVNPLLDSTQLTTVAAR